jgi:RimJ/RimL family protein N-acetyltransferase
VIGDKTMWRCGVARELYAWTIPFAFLHLNVRKVKAVIFGANESSIALTESLGFQREALLRSEYPSSEKDRLDIHIFGLMKEEWLALKGAGQQPWCWDWLPPVAAGAFDVR